MWTAALFNVVVLWSLLFVSVLADGARNLLLEEEQPAGTFVANIVEEAHLDAKFSPEVLTELRFRFLSKLPASFIIEDKTGIIRTSDRIDRESICPSKKDCLVKLDVAIHPVQYLEIIKVNVEIVDINDNWPQFPAPVISHQILESAALNTTLVIPNAQDPDSPELGVQRYRLVSSNNKFKLDVRRKSDGNFDVRLVLVGRLNRETKDQYKMQVIAYDGGQPEQSGTVDITVTVQDANDNNPKFDESTYRVTIHENIPLHRTIIQVHATDPDLGLNGELVYSLFAQTKSEFGHLFGIDNRTGEIFVKGVIDYEEASIYHLGVEVKDRGPGSLPGDATVIVMVLDENDHAPEITVNTLSAPGTTRAEIAEDVGWNTFVAHITVEDKDKGEKGKFNCTLNSHMFELKHMYEGEYKIVTSSLLDREERSQYDLVIQCKDGGQEPAFAVSHLTVIVLDVNDHTPMFDQLSYTAKLIENNFVGAEITQVNATDMDIGKNAEIRYSVPREIAHLFNVNPITGRITAAQSLDHEKLAHYSFPLIARDNGSLPRSAEATVHVTVENVNDDEPTFEQSLYTFKVFERVPLGTVIGTVSATDADKPPYNVFSYHLLPSGNMADLFRVEAKTGDIVSQLILDREAQDEYFLIIVAEDEGASPLTGTTSVIIHVQDRNDNDPKFIWPLPYNNTVHLSNRVPAGEVIATVKATDPDVDENGQVTFDFTAGNEDHFFEVDSTTGQISLLESVAHLEYKVFVIEVTAADQGKPQGSAKETVYIVVNSSIPYARHGASGLSQWFTENYLVVTIAACTLGVVIVILAIIIAIVCRHMMGKRDLGQSYNCRTEALKALAKKREEKEKQFHNDSDNEVNEKTQLRLDLDTYQSKGTWNSLDRKPAQKRDPNDQHPHSQNQQQGQSDSNQYSSGQRTPHPRALHTTRWPWKVTNSVSEEDVDMEMQQLLHVLRQDPTDHRGSSGSLEGSTNTDSGHGASDEYDPSRSRSPAYHPSPHHKQVVKNSTFPRNGHAPPGSSCVSAYESVTNEQAVCKSPNKWTRKNGYISLPQATPRSGSNTSLSSDNSSGQGVPTGGAFIYKAMPGVKMSELASRAQQQQFTGDMVVDTETGCPGAGEVQYTALNMTTNNGTTTRDSKKQHHHPTSSSSSSSSSSSASTVEAGKLCDHIDNLFFKDQQPNGSAMKQVAV